MKNIYTYIFEKLVIDKDTHLTQYKRGDRLCITWLEDFEIEDTGEVVQMFRVGFSGKFEKYDEPYLYIRYDDGEEREIEILKNKHNFFEDIDSKTSCTLFMPLENAKMLIKDALRMETKDFVNNVLFKEYFEVKKDVNIYGIKEFYGEKNLRKTLREINAELKKVHK